jgi:thioredoxin-dependent peroxiredoxin
VAIDGKINGDAATSLKGSVLLGLKPTKTFMKSITSFLTLIFMMVAQFSFAQTKPTVGTKAPDFTAKDQDGNSVSLHDYIGKKVILYFYPKDGTPGCTAEACNLRDNNEALTKAGYVTLGVSTDDEASHKDFKQKNSLPFSLIADTDKSINQKYGVWVEKERDGKKFFGTARTTFLIDEKGMITHVIDKVDTKEHSTQILN